MSHIQKSNAIIVLVVSALYQFKEVICIHEKIL